MELELACVVCNWSRDFWEWIAFGAFGSAAAAAAAAAAGASGFGVRAVDGAAAAAAAFDHYVVHFEDRVVEADMRERPDRTSGGVSGTEEAVSHWSTLPDWPQERIAEFQASFDEPPPQGGPTP